jgi:hypothetical protein
MALGAGLNPDTPQVVETTSLDKRYWKNSAPNGIAGKSPAPPGGGAESGKQVYQARKRLSANLRAKGIETLADIERLVDEGRA